MVPKTCTIEACDSDGTKRGMCNKHYLRVWKYGNPYATKAYLDPAEAFNARTIWRDGCLIWTGGVTDDGYGRLRVGESRELTHRYAWEAARGPIPEGLVVDHTCHVPACCNVDHLRLATNKQNAENLIGPRSTTMSGHLGVHRHGNRWRVRVRHYGVTHNGGSFQYIEEAAEAARALRNRLYTHNDRDRVSV